MTAAQQNAVMACSQPSQFSLMPWRHMDNAGQQQAPYAAAVIDGIDVAHFGYGYSGGIPTSAIGTNSAKEGLIESTTTSITDATERLAMLSNKIQALADATFGSVPQLRAAGDVKAPGCAPSSGRADDLRRKSAMLHGAISTLESEFERLRGL